MACHSISRRRTWGGLEGLDPQFVMLRIDMREKIFEYIERKPSSTAYRQRLPELAKCLEEILYRKFSNKNDYYNMMKGPIEPQLLFAIKTLSAQNQRNQRNQQMSRQMEPSSGYSTMIPTPGITQGATGNSRMPYVTDNTGSSSSGSSMVPQSANMGSGVGGADGLPQHQQMQDVGGLGGLDHQFVMLRNNMREKIFDYIGRKQSSTDWQPRLPELAKRLEEILYRKFSNKNDYYNMMNGPVEPQLQFAIKTLSAQTTQSQQNQQMSRQMASSSGYGTMIPTPGITQGATGNSRMPYVTDNTGSSSSGSSMVPQSANMGSGVGGADGLPQHQQMQDVGGLGALDPQFVMLRNAMHEKIFAYIGSKPSSTDYRRHLPELAKRLEEILYRKFSNKNDYFNMMKGPFESQLVFAIKTLSAQNQRNQQNQQISGQMASSSGYGTMIPTPGITQGACGNSRI